jgi:hypothetical protein
MATTIWYSNPTTGNAMNFTDSNQWNTATDGSGTAGNPDSTDDKAVIQAGDTVTLDANVTTGGCSNEGTLIGNASFSLTLAGNDTDNNYNNSGTVTNLNLIMTGIRASGDRTVVDVGSGIRDFTLNDTTNSGNNVHILGNNLSIDGDLTITSGTLNTQSFGTDRSLTVAGTTQVTGTLTCNASTVSLGSGLTSGWGLDIQTNGTFNGGSGTHTIGSIFAASGGTKTITLSSGATTINSKNTGNGFTINLASGTTFNHGSGTVTMTYAGDTLNQLTGGTLAFNTFTYNASGRTLELRSAMSCAANLTITAGTLDTKSGTNNALTVTGNVDISGTLTCNASAVSFGSLKCQGSSTLNATSGTTTITSENSSGQAIVMNNTMTFDNNDGTFLITTPAATNIYFKSDNALHHLTINHSSADIVLAGNPDDLKCEGDLTITAGILRSTTSGATLEVDGDASVTGTLNWSGTSGGAVELGSLTINDGGTYNATSGTTTITDEGDGSGGTNGYAWYNVTGTYTHNNGTVKFTGNSDTDIREDAFYNLIINGDTSSVDFYIRQKDGSSSSSGHIKIFNNLDIQRGGFQRAKSANELSVFGIIDICSGGTGGYFGDTSDTGIYNLGAVNIHNNGTLNLSNGDNNINSIRNIAGTVAQD